MNGKYLKKLRIEKGLTQTELALALGYSGKSAIARIESDAFELSQDKIKKYADFFGVSVLDIMGISAPEEPDETLKRLLFYYELLSSTKKEQALKYLKFLSQEDT